VGGAGEGGEFGGAVGGDRSDGGIDVVGDDLVSAQVGNEEMLAGCVEGDAVGEGLLLARGVNAGAVVLEDGGGGQESAVVVDGEGGDGGAVIVGDGEKFSGGMKGEVRGICTAGGLPVERYEIARLHIDGEGFNSALVVVPPTEPGGGDGIKEFAIGMKCEEIGAIGGAGEAWRREGGGGGIEAGDVDAAGVGVGGVSDVKPVTGVHRISKWLRGYGSYRVLRDLTEGLCACATGPRGVCGMLHWGNMTLRSAGRRMRGSTDIRCFIAISYEHHPEG
jgi:hypothetical protein